MKVALDSAGRLVIPKSLRQALGLKPGQPMDIRAGDRRLEIEVAPIPMRLKKRGRGVVAAFASWHEPHETAPAGEVGPLRAYAARSAA